MYVLFIGLGDALGVDWSSIVQESKRKVKEESQISVNTAKQKLKPHRVLLNIGISAKMAGKEFAKQVIQESYALLEEEIRQEVHLQIRNESLVKNEYSGKNIKGENEDANIENENPEENKFVSLEQIEQKLSEKLPFTVNGLLDRSEAFEQVGYKNRMESRRKLIAKSIGFYSRALSARKDLGIRRKLCGLPEEEVVEKLNLVTPVVEATTTIETDLPQETTTKQSATELVFAMFKKAIGEVC